MVIIERYIFKGFISTFLFCVFILWILFIIGDIFGFLDEILRERIPVASLIAFYWNMTPFILIQMIPVSTLIACVYFLGNLNRHSEITALRASGIGIWKILRPMLAAAFIISLAVFITNDRFLPSAMRTANRIRYEKLDVGKRDKDQSIKVRNVAIYGYGNRIIFAREFDVQKNILKDVIIHKHDPTNDLILKISAREMRWTEGKKWHGTGVILYRLNNKGEFMGDPVVSTETDISIAETPTDFINNQWKPEFMSYAQLKKYVDIFATSSKRTERRLLVDLNHKIAFPFTCLITILISAPFALSTKRGGALMGMAKGIVVALLYIPVMAIGLALGKGGILPPVIAAWLSNILFGGLGIYFLNKY
ncbi:MAG: YjgP/YjgQ family permease [Candidatus Omnitrophica bacterium]|nr:YjgP/YjgQ family permease [Candidatus Omnitrophota bacterium]